MLLALQFAAAVFAVGIALKIGDFVSAGIEDALGDKPLRDRGRD